MFPQISITFAQFSILCTHIILAFQFKFNHYLQTKYRNMLWRNWSLLSLIINVIKLWQSFPRRIQRKKSHATTLTAEQHNPLLTSPPYILLSSAHKMLNRACWILSCGHNMPPFVHQILTSIHKILTCAQKSNLCTQNTNFFAQKTRLWTQNSKVCKKYNLLCTKC